MSADKSERFSQLYEKLKKRGVIDSLQSQLRSCLINELLPDAPRQKPASQFNNDLTYKADRVVAEYLQRAGYDYSLCTFMPEAGLPNEWESIESQMLFSSLHSGKTKTPGETMPPVLLRLIEGSDHTTSPYKAQTEIPALGLLSPNPPGVEAIHFVDNQISASASIEQRIMKIQRQLEEKYKSDLEFEMKNFRTVELSKMKVEEQDRWRKELDTYRKQMETEYQQRYQAMVERERKATAEIDKQRHLAEKEQLAQRQQIQRESEEVRKRQEAVVRHTELHEKQMALDKRELKQKELALEERQLAFGDQERQLECRVQTELDKLRTAEQNKLAQRYQQLESAERHCQAKIREVEEEKDRLKNVLDDLAAYKTRVAELDAVCEQNRLEASRRHQLITSLQQKVSSVADYQTVKEQSLVARTDVEHLQQRVTELSQQLEAERRRSEQLLQRSGAETNSQLRQADLALQATQNELQSQREAADRQRESLTRRLDVEVTEKHAVIEQLASERLRYRQISIQLDDLKQQLNETRHALLIQTRMAEVADENSQTPFYQNDNLLRRQREHMVRHHDRTVLSPATGAGQSSAVAGDRHTVKPVYRSSALLSGGYRLDIGSSATTNDDAPDTDDVSGDELLAELAAASRARLRHLETDIMQLAGRGPPSYPQNEQFVGNQTHKPTNSMPRHQASIRSVIVSSDSTGLSQDQARAGQIHVDLDREPVSDRPVAVTQLHQMPDERSNSPVTQAPVTGSSLVHLAASDSVELAAQSSQSRPEATSFTSVYPASERNMNNQGTGGLQSSVRPQHDQAETPSYRPPELSQADPVQTPLAHQEARSKVEHVRTPEKVSSPEPLSEKSLAKQDQPSSGESPLPAQLKPSESSIVSKPNLSQPDTKTSTEPKTALSSTRGAGYFEVSSSSEADAEEKPRRNLKTDLLSAETLEATGGAFKEDTPTVQSVSGPAEKPDSTTDLIATVDPDMQKYMKLVIEKRKQQQQTAEDTDKSISQKSDKSGLSADDDFW